MLKGQTLSIMTGLKRRPQGQWIPVITNYNQYVTYWISSSSYTRTTISEGKPTAK